jgi:hypothetical protein
VLVGGSTSTTILEHEKQSTKMAWRVLAIFGMILVVGVPHKLLALLGHQSNYSQNDIGDNFGGAVCSFSGSIDLSPSLTCVSRVQQEGHTKVWTKQPLV